MLRLRFLFTLSLSLFITLQSVTAEKPDLVIEVFRHGARGPMNQTYDPNQDWGDSVQELTPVGMRMHYILGAALKDKYAHLLDSYDPDEIYVRSTDVNRTIMSAYSHMYGVYGTSGPKLGDITASQAIPPYSSPVVQEMAEKLSNEYALPNNLQVVPVHVVPNEHDYILASYMACPKGKAWLQENVNDSESLEVFVNELTQVTSYLQSQGLQVETYDDLYILADNAIANFVQEKELPAQIDPESEHYRDLKFAFEWYTMKMVAGSPQQVTLYPRDLLYAIADYMRRAITGESNLKFAFLSAHDTTLVTLLNAFDITSTDCLLENYKSQKQNKASPFPHCKSPAFASNLIFEFYNTTKPYIKLYYDGLPVPFCGNKDNTCSFEDFVPYISLVTNGATSNDYREACEFPDTLLTANIEKLQLIVMVLTVISLISIAGLLFALFKKSFKKPKSPRPTDGGKWFSLSQEKEEENGEGVFRKNATNVELSSAHALRT